MIDVNPIGTIAVKPIGTIAVSVQGVGSEPVKSLNNKPVPAKVVPTIKTNVKVIAAIMFLIFSSPVFFILIRSLLLLACRQYV